MNNHVIIGMAFHALFSICVPSQIFIFNVTYIFRNDGRKRNEGNERNERDERNEGNERNERDERDKRDVGKKNIDYHVSEILKKEKKKKRQSKYILNQEDLKS